MARQREKIQQLYTETESFDQKIDGIKKRISDEASRPRPDEEAA